MEATELLFSLAVSPGSVVFHLSKGSDEELLLFADLDPTPALIDRAVSGLLDVVEDGQDGTGADSVPPLAIRLRTLGPRTAKHLNDLVDRVVSDKIDVELTWSGAAQLRTADLTIERASLLREVISSNQQEVHVVTVLGRLRTISTVTSADLIAEDGTRYKITVPAALRPALGRYYDQQVEVTLREVITWSTSTGAERKAHDLIDVRRPGSSSEDVLSVDQAPSDSPAP